jgi:hypothetical protein
MIQLDLTEEELRDTVLSDLPKEEILDTILLFQSKNRKTN